MTRLKGDGLPPLEIKLFATPREVTDDDLRGAAVVVVDILRSSSTIACALDHGAKEVIPVQTPAEGSKLAGRSRNTTLLCGEREGKKINGFDLGNSPLEYAGDKVGGKILIFTSTNGSAAVLRARVAERVYVGGFNNFSAVVRRLQDDGLPIVILCAGKFEQFSLEDFVGGGKIVSALESRLKRELILNDGARAATLLHRHFDGNIPALFKASAHGQYLLSLGGEQDLEYCARVDTHLVVPTFVEGKIRGYRPDGSPTSEFAPSTL